MMRQSGGKSRAGYDAALARAAGFIRAHGSFLVTTHVFPDGDAIGSQLALCAILRALGKRGLPVNDHATPGMYRFMDRRGVIGTVSADLPRALRRCDAAIAVDVSASDRTGRVGEAVRAAGIPLLCIDHHKTNSRFGQLNLIDGGRAASGEIVLDLARAFGVPLTRRMAEWFFVALATDTGWFRFPNTTPAALRCAAELIAAGARSDRVYSEVHERMPWRRVRLLERALGTLGAECGGRIAHLCVTDEMKRETGAQDEDTEGFVDVPRQISGVEVVLFFREAGGKVKVSMRSRGPAIDGLAKRFGGGGHAQAAGIVLDWPLRRAMKEVLAAARRVVKTGRA